MPRLHHVADTVLVLVALALGALVLHLGRSAGFSGDRALWLALPAVAAIGCVAALRGPRALRINLVSALVATVAALYAAELFLARSMEAASPARVAAEARGAEFDRRSKLEVVTDLRDRGVSAFPAVHGRLFRLERSDRQPLEITVDGVKKLPVAGPSHRTIVVCNETGRYLTYRSDRFGFHNPPGVWDLPRFDVAGVGDSFTHGACVPSGEGLMARIRERYPATLNLGLDGNGPLAMLATIREYLPAARPERVLWVYYETNDLADLEEEARNSILRRYLEPGFSQDLRALQPEISPQLVDFLSTALREEVRTVRSETLKLGNVRTALGLRGFNPIQGKQPTSADDCCDLALFSEVLATARRDVEGWGGRLYFVYLPGWRRFNAPSELGVAERARDSVLATVERNGIPLVDLAETFAGWPDGSSPYAYPGPYSHLNEAGYLAASREILEALERAE